MLRCTTSKANSSTKRIETKVIAINFDNYLFLQRPIPVQKGLKHVLIGVLKDVNTTSKANSSTKRIETRCGQCRAAYRYSFKGQFQYKKDWNNISIPYKNEHSNFKGQFQYKKDWNTAPVVLIIKSEFLQRPIPVQKGLKRAFFSLSASLKFCFKGQFQYKKDWNMPSGFQNLTSMCDFKGQFQYKKDWNKTNAGLLAFRLFLQRPIPVQKGLKQVNDGSKVKESASSKANSSTKRIETSSCKLLYQGEKTFKGQFQYKKDWNTSVNTIRTLALLLQRPIPVQKGLKQALQTSALLCICASKANSSTKRIETHR